MKYFFTLLLTILFFFNSQLLVGQSVDQQEREKIAMSRLAEEQENSSAESGILWGRLVVTIILFGVFGMFNQAKEKEKRQTVRLEEYRRQQKGIAANSKTY